MIFFYGSPTPLAEALVRSHPLLQGAEFIDDLSHLPSKEDHILMILPPSFDLDFYEIHRERAYSEISSTVAKAVAAVEESAEKNELFIIFLSSVAVFSNETERPFKEDDKPGPVSVFGDACYLAERRLLESGLPCSILRTGGVLGFGDYDTWRYLAPGNRSSQIILPEGKISLTSVRGLAECMARLLDQRAEGLYHFSYQGEASPVEVAVFMAAEMKTQGLIEEVPQFEERDMKDIPLGAERLRRALLDTTKYCKRFHTEPGHWQAAVIDYVESLVKNSGQA